MSLTIQPIPAFEARPLRGAVLRPGQPAEHNIYPLDYTGRDYHAGAFEDGELVGAASVYHEAAPGEQNDSAWRLRGMVVLPEWQRRGYGRALLNACKNYIVDQGGTLLWCNARLEAVPFYAGDGFESSGEPFDVPGSGLHLRMSRTLEPAGED